MPDSGDIRRDRQRDPGLRQKMARVLLDSGAQAVVLHRIAHALYKRDLPGPAAMVRRLNIFLTGADIHPAARLGPGVALIHSVGIIIGQGVVVEDGCDVYGGVVLGGVGGRREDDGFPHIRRNTVICVGAKVLGPITVGPGATVAAGAVVLTSVPVRALAAGVPSRVVKIYDR